MQGVEKDEESQKGRSDVGTIPGKGGGRESNRWRQGREGQETGVGRARS